MCCYYLFCFLWPCGVLFLKQKTSQCSSRQVWGESEIRWVCSVHHLNQEAFWNIFFSWLQWHVLLSVVLVHPRLRPLQCRVPLFFLTSTCFRAFRLSPPLLFLYSFKWFPQVLGLDIPPICLSFPNLYVQLDLPSEFRIAYLDSSLGCPTSISVYPPSPPQNQLLPQHSPLL